jgi:hypothetical protein
LVSYDSGPMTAERVRLRIGNIAKAVLVTGQAYQEPKDALNEFVSNAADEYPARLGAGGGGALRRRPRHRRSLPRTSGWRRPS